MIPTCQLGLTSLSFSLTVRDSNALPAEINSYNACENQSEITCNL